MKIRKLEKKELLDAFLISAYCFHMRLDDPEAERENLEKAADTQENWGAFDDDGTMMAHIIDFHFPFYLDGQEIPVGGIGCVSTLPEYRDRGSIREIFKELLPDAYQNGEVLSTLYPFKHAFYRKAGYEVVSIKNEYSFAPAVLCDYRFDGEVKKWQPGDTAEDFLAVYRAFAAKFNLAMVRDEERMQARLKVNKPYMDRKFSYVFRQHGEPVAYLIFTDVRHDPKAVLKAEECAWTCREGFYAILGFLARFEADYGEIRLPLPKGIDLLYLVRSPRAYDIGKRTLHNFMVRVVNAKRLLELIEKPADCDFTIRVTDELIAENNAVFRVQGDEVTKITADRADIELDQRALAQMAVGAVNFEEALLRMDVAVHAKEEMLRSVFTEKNIYIAEHF